jgi:hypothetical protein
MEKQKSQLELKNALVNHEMKLLFNNKTTSNKLTVNSNNPTPIPQMVTPIETHSAMMPNSSNMASITVVAENKHTLSSKIVNTEELRSSIKVVSIQQQQQQQQPMHNETVENDSTLMISNLTSDIYICDDLSLLPVIDDKSLLSTLRAKFESRKYFV